MTFHGQAFELTDEDELIQLQFIQYVDKEYYACEMIHVILIRIKMLVHQMLFNWKCEKIENKEYNEYNIIALGNHAMLM